MRPAVRRNYVLALLTVILLFNYVDRIALGVVLQDIKLELDLSDTQLGFLSGIAFALFYSVMGIPIGRWADRGNRVTIISLAALTWSAAVALCGTAVNFAQLMLIRIGVGVGEAGCIPPAFSLLADYFDRTRRPRAMAIYGMGGALSFIVGFFLAGWLNELYGWRVTFMVLAAPGLVLALVACLSLKEPRRMSVEQRREAEVELTADTAVDSAPSIREVGLTLLHNRTFLHLVLCMSVLYLFGYGILQWIPTFFIRSYGFTSSQVGLWMAVTYGAGGLIGAYLGGEWATRCAARDERLQLRMTALMYAGAFVFQLFIYIAPSAPLALALLFLSVLAPYATNAAMFATIQGLVPERMRASAIAVFYMVANLVGMGFGPLLAGVLSDAFRSWAGEESLRYALMSLAPGYLWGCWHAWRASRSVMNDLDGVRKTRVPAPSATDQHAAWRASPARIDPPARLPD